MQTSRDPCSQACGKFLGFTKNRRYLELQSTKCPVLLNGNFAFVLKAIGMDNLETMISPHTQISVQSTNGCEWEGVFQN